MTGSALKQRTQWKAQKAAGTGIMRRNILARAAASIAGLVLVVYGVIAGLSPLPAGAPLAILGLLMIAAANPAARPFVRHLRSRWRWFDHLVKLIGKSAPERVKSVISETEPAKRPENDEC